MAGPTLSRSPRAARRAEQRAQRVAPVAGGPPSALTWERGLLVAWFITTALLFWYELGALRAKVTWYLAVDQLGYLLFARDLLAGHAFHQWPPAAALATRLPDPTDVLAQSY